MPRRPRTGSVLLLALLALPVAAGCSGTGSRNVLDLTWGAGWNSRGASSPYGEDPPTADRSWAAYYEEHVRTEDGAGVPIPPVEQVEFLEAPASNAPTGEPVRPASFVDTGGRPVRLEDYRGKRSLVLVFTRGFPGYLCPMCTSYTAQIAHRYAEIVEAGGEVLLVFPGSPDRVEDFVKAARAILEERGPGALPYPVLLDPQLAEVAAFGIRGDLARPSTFVVDREGRVRYAFVGEQPHERPDVDTILAELKRAGTAR